MSRFEGSEKKQKDHAGHSKTLDHLGIDSIGIASPHPFSSAEGKKTLLACGRLQVPKFLFAELTHTCACF